jgi:alpha-1,3-mannosyltransferase
MKWLTITFSRMARNTSMLTIIHNVLGLVKSLLFDPRYFWSLATLVIIGDAVLTELIIKAIPCTYHDMIRARSRTINPSRTDTEIDWETYMVQTEIYIKGQHNYTLITGPTGPLVHVRSPELGKHWS